MKKKNSVGLKKVWNDQNSIFNSNEYRTKLSESLLVAQNKFETNKKRSDSLKGAWQDPNSTFNSNEYRRKKSRTMKELRSDPNNIYNSDEHKKNMSKSVKTAFQNPDIKQRHLESVSNPKARLENSKRIKAIWDDLDSVYNSDEFKLNRLKRQTNPESNWRKNHKRSVNASGFRRIHSERMLNGGAARANSFVQNPSKSQVLLFEKVRKIYPDAVLNYPVLNFSIDVAIPQENIAIEYDGSYWHQGRKEEDAKRQKELENIGWKFLRYVDYVPKTDILKNDLHHI